MVEARCPCPQLLLIILPAHIDTIPHLSIITQRPPPCYISRKELEHKRLSVEVLCEVDLTSKCFGFPTISSLLTLCPFLTHTVGVGSERGVSPAQVNTANASA